MDTNEHPWLYLNLPQDQWLSFHIEIWPISGFFNVYTFQIYINSAHTWSGLVNVDMQGSTHALQSIYHVDGRTCYYGYCSSYYQVLQYKILERYSYDYPEIGNIASGIQLSVDDLFTN